MKVIVIVAVLFFMTGTLETLPYYTDEAKCGYSSCPKVSDSSDVVNIHVVCHTHDDVGWLKTVDQYFYGAKNYIQNVGVRFIIDSVIQELVKDPKRKFIYVESGFFWRWWKLQNEQTKQLVRHLVDHGQLEFIGGGWSMNDEATPFYTDIIDNMAAGTNYLKRLFGECGNPKVAWQIDPFGHSREQASLFAQMGYDGLFFARLDYQDDIRRRNTKSTEFVWESSPNQGPSSDLFTSILPDHYGPPPGFCFDILCRDEPIMDDPTSHEYNADVKVESFLSFIKNYMKSYTTNHILIPFGSDFHYQQADQIYTNLDKLIHHVNSRNGTQYRMFYSTPSCYLQAVNNANKSWSTKKDDFFPYANDAHSYWTGYFTSRPALKYFTRMTGIIYQAAKQLYGMTDLPYNSTNDALHITMDAMGILQHHDGVSGTSRQHVADDYARYLGEGVDESEVLFNAAFQKLMPKTSGAQIPKQYFCNFLNISSCNIVESSSRFTVTLYNPISHAIDWPVRIPVSGASYDVVDGDGNTISSQIVPIPMSVFTQPGRVGLAKSDLVFLASEVPAFGYVTYHITLKSSHRGIASQRSYIQDLSLNSLQDAVIINEELKVTVDGETGRLKSITEVKSGTVHDISQGFFYYLGFNGHNMFPSDRASGAYVFRPQGQDPLPVADQVEVKIVTGNVVSEIWQKFNPWISQIIRLYKKQQHAEFEWLVGPIPIDDNIGKEVISRFETNYATNRKFYTDSNGREILERVRDYRPTWNLANQEPVSGNYYPVTQKIFIADATSDKQLTVIVDRAQGGSSIRDGQIELMVHRRLLMEDAFGVGEALNEPGFDFRGLIVRGKQFVIPSSIVNGARLQRELGLQMMLRPQPSFARTSDSAREYADKFSTKWTGLKKDLPPNVNILTLQPWTDNTLLLRLEHIFELNEDAVLSKPTAVNIQDMFSSFTILNATELNLSANREIKTMSRLNWLKSTNSVGESSSEEKMDYEDYSEEPLTAVTLRPMQIRTFAVTVRRN